MYGVCGAVEGVGALRLTSAFVGVLVVKEVVDPTGVEGAASTDDSMYL